MVAWYSRCSVFRRATTSVCYRLHRMAEPVTGGEDYDLHRQLAVVDTVTPISHSISNPECSPLIRFSPPFSIPNGWFVHKVPRSDGLRVDKYYIEPETGRKFRSRKEVIRYLNFGECKATRFRPLRLDYRIRNLSTQTMITSGETTTPESKWITKKFTLPEDWFVEKVPRKTGSSFDKYYHDPETGRKFRSLKDVERYLTEGCIPTRSKARRLKYHEKHFKNCNNQKKILSCRKMLDFVEDKNNQCQLLDMNATSLPPSTSPFKLPDGLIVEEVPRKTGNRFNRYYYEPGTGKRFQSLPDAKKHLAELEENSPLSVVLEELRENNLPLSKAFKLSSSIKNHCSYGSWKKSISKKEQDSSFGSPPSKINWVIASSRGDAWNAFVGDTLISDSRKQQWGTRFMLAINNSKHNPPVLA